MDREDYIEEYGEELAEIFLDAELIEGDSDE